MRCPKLTALEHFVAVGLTPAPKIGMVVGSFRLRSQKPSIVEVDYRDLFALNVFLSNLVF